MKLAEKIIWIVALIAVIVLIGVLGYGYYQKVTYNPQNPIATMEVEGFGTIKIELYPEQAPETVSNFIALANNGFYNGTKFHRILKDFVIQGGSKDGEGKQDATLGDLQGTESTEKYSIKGEFLLNGVKNTTRFEEGTIAMARADYTSYYPNLAEESYNSGCSEFFILTKENEGMKSQYTGFGKVIEGLDIVHKIEKVEVKAADSGSDESNSNSNSEVSTPVNPPVVKSLTVETFGENYGMPETLTPFDINEWFSKMYGMNQ